MLAVAVVAGIVLALVITQWAFSALFNGAFSVGRRGKEARQAEELGRRFSEPREDEAGD